MNLTDMQEHEHLNREAIAAGKHVWSEKPIANSLAAGAMIGHRQWIETVGRADSRHESPICLHGAGQSRRGRLDALPRHMRTTDTPAPVGPPSSTKKEEGVFPTWESIT